MDFLIDSYANVSGLWKKIAAVLPLVAGAGSVLIGAGHIAINLSHLQGLSAILNALTALGPTDPNVAMILAGITALGIQTNHNDNAAVIANHDAALGVIKIPEPTPPVDQKQGDKNK